MTRVQKTLGKGIKSPDASAVLVWKGELTGENILLSTQSLVGILAHSSYIQCYVRYELSQYLSIVMDLFIYLY